MKFHSDLVEPVDNGEVTATTLGSDKMIATAPARPPENILYTERAVRR